jgi:hypothetical protein
LENILIREVCIVKNVRDKEILSMEQGSLTAGNGEIIIMITDFWWGEKTNSGFACFVYYFSSFFY